MVGVTGKVIDWEAACRNIPGGPAAVRQLAKIMRDECVRLLEEVRRGVDGGDARLVRIGAHTIKGAATHFGAQRVVDAAAAMEVHGRDGDLAGARAALPAFAAEVEALIAAAAEADSVDLGD
jgi:HPt (histidine-containing phosphotransfer) domain-containing protein